MTMRFGSFCSGIGAPECAWRELGWEPQFFSEIEPFPCAVLAERFPGVPNLGDMRAVHAALIYAPRAIRNRLRKGKPWQAIRNWLLPIVRILDAARLLVAGTPCQAFSVAGRRESLADDRGNLSLVFVELVHAIDPEFVVWENVPGVLSTADNAFGCFLAGLVGERQPLVCGGGSWPVAGMVVGPRRSAAWRVLDAQYFGVAQRRRRVFVVSCRTGDGTNPGAILFEPECLPGHPAPRREAGARVAASLACSTDAGGEEQNLTAANAEGDDGLPFLTRSNIGKGVNNQTPLITHSLRAEGFDASEDGSGRGVPIIPILEAGKRHGRSNSARDGTGIGRDGDQMFTLQRGAQHAVAIFDERNVTSPDNRAACRPDDPVPTLHQSPMAVALLNRLEEHPNVPQIQMREMRFGDDQRTRSCVDCGGAGGQDPMPGLHAIAFQTRIGRNGRGQPEEICPTLQGSGAGATSDMRPVIAFQERGRDGGRNVETQADIAYSLNAPNGGGRRQENTIASAMRVRRLLPVECERLQGFPDGWTDIIYRGRPAADGPRYRAIGNSMAVPVLKWIGMRIEKVLAARAEAA